MNGGDVILADEPTGALDSHSGEEVMNILRELHQRGHTVIIVTHDMQVASNAQRIIELHDGAVISDRPNGVQTPDQTTLLDAKPSAMQALWQAAWGRFGEAFKMAWIAMASHRMRTLLTMLGIIIGITSVVSIVALGQGARQKVINDISSIGTNTIDIVPGNGWGDDRASTIHTLGVNDLSVLQQQFYIDSATPGVSGSVILRYGNVKASASVSGVGEQYFRVRDIEMAEGQAFSTADVHRQAQSVVIDDNTRNKLFKTWEQPVGKVIFSWRHARHGGGRGQEKKKAPLAITPAWKSICPTPRRWGVCWARPTSTALRCECVTACPTILPKPASPGC